MHVTDPSTLATFSLAGLTFLLVLATYLQVRASRVAFDWSIRPLLAEVPALAAASNEILQFGAPGREAVEVADHEFYFRVDENVFQFSVPFRNVGNGVAAITGVEITPDAPGDCVFSRKFVRPGEHVRVNKSVHLGSPESGPLIDNWQQSLAVTVEYRDARGGRPLRSSAKVRGYATHAPFVEWIEISFRTRSIVVWRKKWKTLVLSGHSAG
jgi:hypothetical protein